MTPSESPYRTEVWYVTPDGLTLKGTYHSRVKADKAAALAEDKYGWTVMTVLERTPQWANG